MYDIQKIMNFLPHRYPFLLVDRILEIDEKHAVGIKNVTINEPFFQGHFPNEPVMPGVLVLEAMGQVAAMMMSAKPGSENLITFLTGVEKAKFRKPVKPGDQLVTTA
jgi:3-hydroxyacyl-[acyl-carrier-protein] dehydratase